MRQPLQFDKGIGRFEEEALFSRREAYINTSSLENKGRKRPLKVKKSIGFQPFIVSFTVFAVFETIFYYFSVFFGLTKCDSPFFFKSY